MPVSFFTNSGFYLMNSVNLGQKYIDNLSCFVNKFLFLTQKDLVLDL